MKVQHTTEQLTAIKIAEIHAAAGIEAARIHAKAAIEVARPSTTRRKR